MVQITRLKRCNILFQKQLVLQIVRSKIRTFLILLSPCGTKIPAAYLGVYFKECVMS
jgi:hypothetical protein